jgi:hypothetical protein
MSSKEKENEQKQGDEVTQAGTATAVLEKPKEFEDYEKVTVLYGWNKVLPESKQFVDKVLFKGGVARNVPYSTVKHWQRGTRADGKNDQICGKISIQAVLPSDATEADFARATGIKPMPVEQFMSQLAGVDLEALATQLGAERLKELIDNLGKHLPETRR